VINKVIAAMAPPTTVNIDSLISALSNDKVIDAFTRALQPSLMLSIKAEFDKLSLEMASRDAKITALEKENNDLRNALAGHARHVEALEMYSRSDNLLVYGLPELFSEVASTVSDVGTNGGDLPTLAGEGALQSEATFVRFCRDALQVELSPNDISICHRLPKTPKMKHRPLVVKFTTCKARSAVLAAKKKLRSSNSHIYINEHLTKQTSSMFSTARAKVKDNLLAGAWTRNGRLMIKLPGGKILTVNDPSELTHYC
jgi:hypothetical protein